MVLPLDLQCVGTSSDSMSYLCININNHYHIPIEGHCGAFEAVRKHDTHTGVDLYAPVGTKVRAIESGIVIRIEAFTGELANSPWWESTMAVHVYGLSGVFVYGELQSNILLQVGEYIYEGDEIGRVERVLKEDKGRPTSMLHLELWSNHYSGSCIWRPDKHRDVMLYDPTTILTDIYNGCT